jgi:transcriptional regulator with XRE-family HTH domain
LGHDVSPRSREPWTPWTITVRAALRASPVSLRELAADCGVSHAELARIAGGHRNATARVARRVAAALQRLSAVRQLEAARCAKHARAVRAALERRRR